MEKEKLSLKSLKENIVRNIGIKKCILIMAAGILLLAASFPVKNDDKENVYTQPEKENSGTGVFPIMKSTWKEGLKSCLRM